VAVTPLRRPMLQLGDEPLEKPKERPAIKLIVGEDGSTEIQFGGDKKEAKPKPSNEGFGRNLAADIDEGARAMLAAYLIEGIEADEEGRREWLDTVNMASNYLGIKLRDPATTVAADGTVCQAVATCMLEAAIKLWGMARAELLPVGGPVKVQRMEVPPAQDPPPAVAGGIGHNGGPPLEPTATGGNGAPGGVGHLPAAGAGGMGAPLASGASSGIGPVSGASAPEPEQPAQSQSDQAGDDLADALERDLNWYLTEGDKGYYPDFSKMLMSRGVIGVAFREVYRCPVERKPLSRWVMAQDLIVQGNPARLEQVGCRVTKETKVPQALMRRLQISGHYLDVPLVRPLGDASPTEIAIGESEGIVAQPTLPRDFEHTVYECCCELGSSTSADLPPALGVLDQDENGDEPGYPLPYHVSIDKDSRIIVRIQRNWKEGDPDHRTRRRFVKYGYVPSFGFYDWGLIHIVGNPTQAATMLQRSGVDASLYANFPAWLVAQGPGSRMENTVYRPNPGEGVKVPVTSGAKLADVFMPFPYKEPSAQSMALEAKLEADVAKLSGAISLPLGEGRIGNTPVGTIMSYIESMTQVPGAVHKDDHIAQGEELGLLRELIAEEPEVLWRGNKTPARRWQVAEELLSPDIAPKADPNTASQIHRLLKVQGLVQLSGQMQFATPDKDGEIVNRRAIYHKAVEVLVGEDADTYEMPKQPPSQQPPPPDPRIVAAQIKAQSDQAKTQGQIQQEGVKHQDRMAELGVESQNREADRQSDETRAALSLAAARVKTGADAAGQVAEHQHEAGQNAADRTHEVGLKAMDHVAQAQQAAVEPPEEGS
jgi:hypothetical protein